MSDFRAIADRVEIEALRGEFTDAVMMRDYDRGASLFTPDGAVRMPHIPVELEGREQIRAWGERVPGLVDYFVQTTHPGTIQLDGDTASGRAYLQELVRFRDGRSHLNYAIYHDRYQRTGDGWKFTERVYEIRYLDTNPLPGAQPQAARVPAGQNSRRRYMSFDTHAGTRGGCQPRAGLLVRLANRTAASRCRRSRKMWGLNGLILTTVGARSGAERTTPVGWWPGPDGSWLIVAAANGGARNPAWYHNIAAHPDN